MKAFHAAAFLALVIAGVALASVASRETSEQAKSVATEAVVRSANLFGDLKVCEVPGVHEHLLAKGTKTLIYAGEFRPTHATPWTTGTARIFLYVISGTGLIQIGNVSAKAGPGDFFIIPKGARHAVSATSAKLRALYFEDRT
jgi:quercetin dioxygenase-like cupin family protein